MCKTEIVGDAEQGTLPQPLEGILHQGDAPAVQPLGRFIRQNQIRPGGDPHGDQYPLAHTAGELKRIAAAQSYTMLQPKGLQQRGRLNQRFFPGTGLILSNGLAKLVAHGIERIESIPASLRNIGDLFPRIRLNSRSRQPNNSRPLRRIEPVTRAEAGSSPSAANSRTLFPLPVSPTTARRSPSPTVNVVSLTASGLSPKRMETPLNFQHWLPPFCLFPAQGPHRNSSAA